MEVIGVDRDSIREELERSHITVHRLLSQASGHGPAYRRGEQL